MKAKIRLWAKIKTARIKILAEKLRKEVLKLTFAVVVAEIIGVIVFSYGVKYGLLELFKTKTVIIQIAEAKTKEVKPEIKEIKQKTAEELADYIHLKESTKGTAKVGLNKTCSLKGLSNEYGYNPPKCYDNNEQVRLIVIDWITRHRAEGMTDEQLLRHYSNNGYGLDTI